MPKRTPAPAADLDPTLPRIPMGPYTRFPGKTRIPFALCMPPELHLALKDASARLGLKRGDVLCELVKQYAAEIEVDADPNDRARLKALRRAARRAARPVAETPVAEATAL